MRIAFIANLLNTPSPIKITLGHPKYGGLWSRAQLASLMQEELKHQEDLRILWARVMEQRRLESKWHKEAIHRQQLLTRNSLFATILSEI